MKHLKLFESEDTGTSKFIAVIHQSGGCDYTIECGTKVIHLESSDLESAKNEFAILIEEEGYTGELKLSNAIIYEFVDEYSVDLNSIYGNISSKRKAIKDSEKEIKDRAEYERLRKRFN